MNNTDLAWAAGIIDGEGCISMNRQRVRNSKRLRNDTYRMSLKVTMGHLETVQRLRNIFGEGTCHNHAGTGPRINASFSWICQTTQVTRVLRLILPYMVTKREEAEVALRYADEVPSGNVGGNGGNRPLTAEAARQRLWFYWKLRMLKSRWRFNILTPEDKAELQQVGLA